MSHLPENNRNHRPICFTSNDLDREAISNKDYRRVVYTAASAASKQGQTHINNASAMQLVYMSLRPKQQIGNEKHPKLSQYIKVAKGSCRAIVYTKSTDKEVHILNTGASIIIPPNTYHNIINESPKATLKLYTIYSSPEHPDGHVEHTAKR